MGKWRDGKSKPTLETRKRIAEALGIALSDVIQMDEKAAMVSALPPAHPVDEQPRESRWAYPSLAAFLEQHPDVTDDERAHLMSIDFGNDGADLGTPRYWTGLLRVYRDLRSGGSGIKSGEVFGVPTITQSPPARGKS